MAHSQDIESVLTRKTKPYEQANGTTEIGHKNNNVFLFGWNMKGNIISVLHCVSRVKNW